MAIQKKSLISNRTATKKALVAKNEAINRPGVSAVAPTRVQVAPSRVQVAPSRVQVAPSRVKY
jgi:hypothetical protein